MGKIKVFFIVIGLLLLGALVGGTIALWPLLAKFGNEIIVPNRAIFTGVGFALAMLWLGTKKWPLWLKIVLSAAALSGASTLSGVSLVELSQESVYQIIIAIFLIISFAVMLWRKSRRNVSTDDSTDDSTKENKKPLTQLLREKWDNTVVKIAGKDKNGGKKIALYTILAIVAGIILFPLITGLVVPIWTIAIWPARDFIWIAIILAIVTASAIFIKNIVLKTLTFGLLLSGTALIFGTDVPTIVMDSLIRITMVYFIAATLFAIPFWGNGKDGDNTGTRLKVSSIIAWVLMMLAAIWLISICQIAGILLVVAGGIVGLVAFICYCTDEMDDYDYLIFHAFYCGILVAVMAVNILLSYNNNDIIKIRRSDKIEVVTESKPVLPTVAKEDYSTIQRVASQNNIKRYFKIERTDIQVLGVIITLEGDMSVKKNASGDCEITICDVVSDDDVPTKTGTLTKSLTLQTSGGKLTIPAGAKVEKNYNTYFYFKVPLQIVD